MQGRERVQNALFGTKPLDEMVPLDHPMRVIRALFDGAWSNLAPAFDTAYGQDGKPSDPIAVRSMFFFRRC
jgi:hypothetical protein